jgi:hypothetical protein
LSRYIKPGKKRRLAKFGRRTRWAPFWTVPRVFGKNRRIHPGINTVVKRSWRRKKTKA